MIKVAMAMSIMMAAKINHVILGSTFLVFYTRMLRDTTTPTFMPMTPRAMPRPKVSLSQ